MEQMAFPGFDAMPAAAPAPESAAVLRDLEWIGRLFALRPRRGRPVTVMFVDVAGFTAYAAQRGDRAAVRLLRRVDQAALPPVRYHGGRIVKRLGDGLMVLFPSPADAVAAALAMQHAVRRCARLALRVGIHHGAARTRDGDLIGHDVNVASRITDRAGGAQILVSAVVQQAANGCRGARFRRVRPLLVAGRPPLDLYRVEET
jgi:adenylate cyclase